MNSHLLPSIYRRSTKLSGLQSSYEQLAEKLCRLYNETVLAGSDSRKPVGRDTIRIVCISDTHNTTPPVPEGDLLIHAGDLTRNGSFEELQAQFQWLSSLPHRFKVVIAGNHDLLLDEVVDRFPHRLPINHDGESKKDLTWDESFIYLHDISVTLTFPNGRHLKVFGTPSSPEFGTWAFQYPPIRDVWTNAIPTDADIVVVHGPPALHRDGKRQGGGYLLRELRRVKPLVTVFGHVHDGYGMELLRHDRVRELRDEIILQQPGLIRTIRMLGLTLLGTLERLLLFLTPLISSSAPRTTTLVKAAVAPGRDSDAYKPAITLPYLREEHSWSQISRSHSYSCGRG